MSQHSSNTTTTLVARPRKGSLLAPITAVIILMLLVLVAFNGQTTKADDIVQQGFDRTWQRTDQLVQEGKVGRTWIWGPTYNHMLTETYQQAPGGIRRVAYLDKSRMEVNNPSTSADSKWFVTNGLLVKEMISGKIQMGDDQFMDYHPAEEALAGDAAAANLQAPTYRSLNGLASLNLDNRSLVRSGQIVTDRLFKAGTVDGDAHFANYQVKYDSYENTLGHNIPNVFTDFFKQQDWVLENGKMVKGTVYDWIYAGGLPLTEPYWTKVKVAGVEKDVLVQAFERRVLTYTPSNDSKWRVEMGNVGMHYYTWRYPNGDTNATSTPSVPGSTPTPKDGMPTTSTPEVTSTPGVTETPTVTPTDAPEVTVTPTVAPTDIPTATPTVTTPIPPCFSMSVGGPVTVNVGGSASVSVNISTAGCPAASISLGVSGGTGLVNASLSSNTVALGADGTASVTLNISVGVGMNPGNISLTVNASAGAANNSAGVGVHIVIPGDFSMSVGAGVSLKISSTASTSINLQALGGFSGPVSLSISGVSLGISASLNGSATLGVNGSGSVGLSIHSSTVVGVAALVITGSSNGHVHSVTVNVTVTLT